MTINEYIHQQRLARGWSLNDLAERAGISKGYLHNLENNPTDPGLDVLQKIAKALGMGAGDMLVAAGYTTTPSLKSFTVEEALIQLRHLATYHIQSSDSNIQHGEQLKAQGNPQGYWWTGAGAGRLFHAKDVLWVLDHIKPTNESGAHNAE